MNKELLHWLTFLRAPFWRKSSDHLAGDVSVLWQTNSSQVARTTHHTLHVPINFECLRCFSRLLGCVFSRSIFFEKKIQHSPPLLSCSTSFGPFLGRLISYRQARLVEQPAHAWCACCWLCMCCRQLDCVSVATHTDCLCNGHVRFILFHTHTKDILEIWVLLDENTKQYIPKSSETSKWK